MKSLHPKNGHPTQNAKNYVFLFLFACFETASGYVTLGVLELTM